MKLFYFSNQIFLEMKNQSVFDVDGATRLKLRPFLFRFVLCTFFLCDRQKFQ